MRFRFFNPNGTRARRLGVCGGVPRLRQSFMGTALCAGALVVGPMAFGPLTAPAQAAPTIGGDENGPQVQILQPAYQDVLRGQTKILIAVKAQKFNPQSVEMFIDDKPNSSGPLALSGAVSSQFNWPTADLTDGPHKLTVRVTDTQGFRGWAEVNVYINNGKKVDTLPPSLGWLNLDAFQQLAGNEEIQLQAVDNFGIKWIIVSVNPASEPNRKPAMRSWLLNRPPYTVKFDTTRVADGLYQFSARAWDSFEQEGVASPLTVGIINRGGINATTIADMLKTMRDAQPAVPRTVPVKTNLESGAALPRANQNTASAAPQPKPPKMGVLAPSNALQPSSPAIVGRATAQSKIQIARGNAPRRAAVAPRLSTSTSPQLNVNPGSQSTFEAEIQGALADDWRTKLARAAAPTGSEKAVPAGASASASFSAPRLAADLSLMGRRELSPDAFTAPGRSGSDRIAAPVGAARPIAGGPVWSQPESLGGTRLAANVPLKFDAEVERREGRASGPDALVARRVSPLARPEVSQPSVSQPSVSRPAASPSPAAPTAPSFSAFPSTASRLSNRVLPAVPTRETQSGPLRLAAPIFGNERAVPLSPQAAMSVSPPTAEPKISDREPLQAAAQTSAAPRAGKVASPDKARFAALPRPQKSGSKAQFNAITVSPLEVKTSDAIPAFHHVARSTDLRAVAARYGLPVDVVAACNNWPSEMKLVAGTNVKLPQQLKIAYQGVPVHADAPALLVGGTGVTAFRFLFEQQGGTMQWDAKRQRVIARKGKSEVVLMIGSNKARVGDKDVMMELAAFLFEGRTMIPVRFFEEGLHAQVEWDPQTGRIVVAMAG